MTWSAGDTFVNQPSPNGPSAHLWIIISDPVNHPNLLVMVNVTTWRESSPFNDPTCVLERGEHPFIKARSFISFADAKSVQGSLLDRYEADGTIVRNQPATPLLLEKIRRAAGDSTRMPLECFELLDEQGLCGPA